MDTTNKDSVMWVLN